jgi:DNA polymerase-3 subunit epsilon
VGPTHVHGITSEMVRDAPSFKEIAPDLRTLFAGRIPVAHRLPQFDGRFVAAHFAWAGLPVPQMPRGICTWKQAKRQLPIARHTLSACCAHLRIPLDGAHQALADTRATAKLLAHFVRTVHTLEGEVVPLVSTSTPRTLTDGLAFFPRATVLHQGG